jgi:hypothetical protein
VTELLGRARFEGFAALHELPLLGDSLSNGLRTTLQEQLDACTSAAGAARVVIVGDKEDAPLLPTGFKYSEILLCVNSNYLTNRNPHSPGSGLNDFPVMDSIGAGYDTQSVTLCGDSHLSPLEIGSGIVAMESTLKCVCDGMVIIPILSNLSSLIRHPAPS